MEVLAAGVAGSLFGYNRENFFFDGEQRIKREYQGQTMRVKQFELFREDIRDLMDLTVSKMDNYLIVNTIQIGLVVVLFTEGRPEPGKAPPWLLFLWSASGVGSFMYITLCIWLAMHASICSHSFCVRMLTQLVRLPVPTKEQLDAARVLATDFEGKRVREMLRVPVVKQQLKKLAGMVDQVSEEADAPERADSNASLAGSDLASSAGAEETMMDADGRPVATDTLTHVKLYRRMQANWQAYDAYARVSMALGTNQFLQQLGYTCLIGFVSENNSVLPGMCSVAIFSTCSALLVRLDLYVSFRCLVLAFVLNTLPPLISGISLILVLEGKEKGRDAMILVGDSLVPAAIALHILWLVMLLNWTKGKIIHGIALPTTFRSVLYLDVFGWLSTTRETQDPPLERRRAEPNGDEEEEEPSPAFELSVVREEEPAVCIPFAGGECRRSLRESLAHLCGEMNAELEHDIGCFEGNDVASLMEDYDKQTVAELRKKLDNYATRLREAGEASSVEEYQANVPVWVKLEWNPSGQAMSFYRRVRAADSSVVWTEPLPPDRVLELEDIRIRLEGLEQKMQMLIAEFSKEEAAPDSALLSVPDERTNSCRGGSASSTTSEVTEMWHTPEGPMDPAQESRYGGSEAVQLADSEVTRQAFLRHPQAGDFHPHRERSNSSSRHQPGQLPWHTIQQGSLVLIAAWCAGFVWSILRLATSAVDILSPPPPHAPELEMISDGPWPRFFEPKGIACHPHGSQLRILIAEKHHVHALDSDDWKLKPSLEEAQCLSEEPRFHAAGLRGIALDCKGEACSKLLLGEGESVLRCEGNVSKLRFYGGPWQLAASGDSDWGIFGQRGAESPALLQQGEPGSFVPTMELGPHPAGDQQWMDSLQGGGLLALSREGVLHAWRPTSPSWLPSGWSYRLPEELGLRWLGLCAARDAFVLGKGRQGRFQLWRLKLPSSLGQG
ncbi:unnamed protein product [Effrenium voratum]|nr:unnamed protein product [Effrenium voratum]